MLFAVSAKNKDEKIFKEEDPTEILKILVLVKNIQLLWKIGVENLDLKIYTV